jgi:hypothetical protein
VCNENGKHEQTYCNYPTSLANLDGDCDAQYIYPPAQRFCPCTVGDCDVPTPVPTTAPSAGCYDWVLGYSGESCTLTCSRVSGECNQGNLEAIVTQQAFYDMVAASSSLCAGGDLVGSADVFCDQGINSYTFAGAPAAFSFQTSNLGGSATENYCNYPTSLSGLTGDCDTTYLYPPAQRFCSCSSSNCFAPSATPTVEPTAEPTAMPSAMPSVNPSADPSAMPSVAPTDAPTDAPSAAPSAVPTVAPSAAPSAVPTVAPTAAPSAVPSAVPSAAPSAAPSAVPTAVPSVAPSAVPTVAPSAAPSAVPTAAPSAAPSAVPSAAPSAIPSFAPSAQPSVTPSVHPTASPTFMPTPTPTQAPSAAPTGCYKFVVGYSQTSCTQVCADTELDPAGQGVCRNEILATINNPAAFEGALSSSILLGSPNNPPTSSAQFCGGGVNYFTFATAPAMFAYQRYIASPTPHFVVDYYCYYPSNMTGDCNTVYNTPPSMRMCACSIASCVDNGSYGVPHYRRALLGESEEEQGQSVSEVEYVQSELMVRGAKVAAVRAAETAAEEAVVEDVMQEEDSVLSYMTAVVGAVATASFVATTAAANTALGISEEYQWVALLGVVGLLAAAAAAVSLVFAAFRKPLESTPAGRKYTATTATSSSSSGRRTKRDIHIDMPDADGLAFGGKMS